MQDEPYRLSADEVAEALAKCDRRDWDPYYRRAKELIVKGLTMIRADE